MSEAQPMRPGDPLEFFTVLNRALKDLQPVPGEEALMAGLDAAGFGPDGHPEWPQTRDYFAQAWPRVVDALAEYLAGAAQTAR